MKTLNYISYIFSSTIFFTVLSCSQDDKTDNLPLPIGTQLDEIEQKMYENGDLNRTLILKYENNKPKLYSFYNTSDALTGTNEFKYDSEGKLTGINGFNLDGTQNYKLTITYDNQNRIIKTVREDPEFTEDSRVVNFTHNPDNTITSSSLEYGSTRERTFVINANGIIDKEIVDGVVNTSAEYDDLKLLSITAYNSTTTYTYANIGANIVSFQSTFGSNPINAVLFQNSLQDGSESLTRALISKKTSDSGSTDYIYTLNDENYPLTSKGYNNSRELFNQLTYSYKN